MVDGFWDVGGHEVGGIMRGVGTGTDGKQDG